MSSVSPISSPVMLPAKGGDINRVENSVSASKFESLMNNSDSPKEQPVLQTNATADNLSKEQNLLNQILASLSSFQNQKGNLELGNNYLFRKNRKILPETSEEIESFENQDKKELTGGQVNDIDELERHSLFYQKHLNWTVKFNMFSGISESFKNSLNKFLQM